MGVGEIGMTQGMYQVAWRPYRRLFQQPLVTQHGTWRERRGLWIRLMRDGRVGWGEIAPLPGFGSETLEEAIAFCRHLPPRCSETELRHIPDDLPACQFGLGMALEQWLLPVPLYPPQWDCCQLLPTGERSLSITGQSGRTYKWKIGVADVGQELAWFEQWVEGWPEGARLRLDANGGLDEAAAQRWLSLCDRLNAQREVPLVEFLEQPLPADQVAVMQRLGDRYATPIALDESVGTLAQLAACHAQGWRGIVVLKPAIAGSPHHIRQACQGLGLAVVWSSVFETALTQQFIAHRIVPTMEGDRAVGFGVNHWLQGGVFAQFDGEALWSHLPAPPLSLPTA